MLAHQGLRTLALAGFERPYDAAVMILSHQKHHACFRQARLNHHESAGGGERKGHGARDLPREHGAVGEFNDDAMEPLVQFDVIGEGADRYSGFENELIRAARGTP